MEIITPTKSIKLRIGQKTMKKERLDIKLLETKSELNVMQKS